MDKVQQDIDSSENSVAVTPQYRNYILMTLTFVYVFNFIDRQILSVLAEPINQELGLQDWQIGFLTGTAFALFYATLGIPIARLADAWNRVAVLTISLSIWSFMTAVSGAVSNFIQLAAARVGVAVGEAGGSPSAVSILSDYFPPNKRSMAMGIYSLGPTIGTFLGFLIGGWISEWLGWRWAFVIVGVPGLLLALLVKFTVREPKRGASDSKAVSSDTLPPFWSVFKLLWKIKPYRYTVIASAATDFMLYGFIIWSPIYVIRSFDIGTGIAGTTMGLVAGIGGSLGVFLGGWLADKFSNGNARWPLLMAAITQAASFPFLIISLVTDQFIIYVLFATPFCMLAYFCAAVQWFVSQSVVPPRTRAMSASILLFVVNLIGLGLGPQVIGIVSDIMRAIYGENGLQYAMLLLGGPSIVAAYYFYKASRSIEPIDDSDLLNELDKA